MDSKREKGKMIQKIVKKCSMDDFSSIREDLAYWLSRPPEERVATVDYLRRQYHGKYSKTSKICSSYSTPTRLNLY